MRFLWQGYTMRLQHRLFLNIKLDPTLGLALAPFLDVEDWDSLGGIDGGPM